nr:hypothetical protein Iba_chr03bCG8360 [Ipomoea batatas]
MGRIFSLLLWAAFAISSAQSEIFCRKNACPSGGIPMPESTPETKPRGSFSSSESRRRHGAQKCSVLVTLWKQLGSKSSSSSSSDIAFADERSGILVRTMDLSCFARLTTSHNSFLEAGSRPVLGSSRYTIFKFSRFAIEKLRIVYLGIPDQSNRYTESSPHASTIFPRKSISNSSVEQVKAFERFFHCLP